MDALLGKTLGHYTIQSLIGDGGMGAVYKALDITLQRIVAVKVMHPDIARQKTFKERFIQEACTAAQLSHPGIIKVFDFGQSEENFYIVIEYIPGVNLAQLLGETEGTENHIILTDAIHLVQQVALAIDYAHQKGVLHRDIKPADIMLKPEPIDTLPYRPIITDLGLAKLAEGGVTTLDRSSMGSPVYMSPEQVLGESLDARSDVYSLGILLYELCTGRLPFPANTISEAINFHTREEPPPPQTIRPDLPENISQLILKALQKQPADRFSDAASFASALENILSNAVDASQNGTQIDVGFSPPQAQDNGVAIFIDHSEITVNPGNRESLAVTLLNQTQIVHHFSINISGVPESWIVSPPPPIQLMPGIQQLIAVTLEPPRSAKGRAGNYLLAVSVSSQENPDVAAHAECMLIVTPFSVFKSVLAPQKVYCNRLIRLDIENQGNHAEDFRISCLERSGEINFNPPKIRVNIPAGQISAAWFRGFPRQKKLFGNNRIFQYTADIESASGQMQSHPGEIVCRPIIPFWAILVLFFLSCLVFGSSGVGYYYYSAVLGTAQAGAVAQTATYIAGLQSSQLQTQTAEQSTYATATVFAITAQAAGDNDNDGISSIQKNTLGADPNNPVTDNDGLGDGLEINQYGANPKNQATATISPTGTVQPTATTWKACPEAAYPSRLSVNTEAIVSSDPPLANRVRSKPDLSSDILGYIQPGEHVKILEGPQCSGKGIWWKVQSLTSDLTGWTSEGDEDGYWLVPVP
jgi:serine/threonine protein kinase